jgi:uncharacterized protein (DUF2267 family)
MASIKYSTSRNFRNWEQENAALRGTLRGANNARARPQPDYAHRLGYEPDERRILPGGFRALRFSGNQENRVARSRNFTRFDKYAAVGNRFIREVADELRTDDLSMALRITKAVLHALRDRIAPDDAVQFAQGLPAMLKAVYFEQYDISGTPVIIRRVEDFIQFVREKNRFAAVHDFPSAIDVVLGIKAVFAVLDRHMDAGQVDQVKRMLPEEISNMMG